ncbi:MAG: DUF4957 domain-containing protein [Prevotella sp.]|nr:DUF4957 domain-containing protein [Prevotella sp.]
MKRIFSAIIAILAFTGAYAQGDYQMNIITKSGKAIAINGEDIVSVTFAEKPVVLNVEAGADLSEVLAEVAGAKSVTLNLAAGEYTFGETVALAGNLQIVGPADAEAKVVMAAGIETVGSVTFKNIVVDASALKVPVIKMSTLPTEGLNEKGALLISGVVVENCKFEGLTYQFFYANKQSYLLNQIKVENSVFAIDGSAKKTIFDFNSGGDVENLTINNSTIYANPASEQNGCFYSTQSGKAVSDLGGNNQVISITNTTMYNICYAKTVSSLRRNSQSWQHYVVKNNIIVNCGKSGQFCKGLNNGSSAKAANFDVDNNVFNFDGAVVAEQGDEGVIKNSIETVVEFADAANGDFTQSNVKVGDPRWF